MRFQEPTQLELFLDGWRNFLSAWDCYDAGDYSEFWETLSMGWMDEYIYPYDDWFNPTISRERKLRLGQHDFLR
jgi:hypothetical protein